MADRIYHIAPLGALRRDVAGGRYAPASLGAEGFVHCTANPATALQVAADYYGDTSEPLVLLAIDPRRLRSPLRYEAPAPAAGAGRAHLAGGERFPHLYGPLELEAVAGAARLERDGGCFVWPAAFGPLAALLADR